jgi:hypothetical protein
VAAMSEGPKREDVHVDWTSLGEIRRRSVFRSHPDGYDIHEFSINTPAMEKLFGFDVTVWMEDYAGQDKVTLSWSSIGSRSANEGLAYARLLETAASYAKSLERIPSTTAQ